MRSPIAHRVLTAGLLTVALAGAAAPDDSLAASVKGKVFHDYNTNGVLDTDATKGAVDAGVSGFTVSAYQGASTLVGTATTDANGNYTLNAPSARVRLELTVPPPWWPTRQLNGIRSDEQFVDASSPVTKADFGVHLAREWSVDNPLVFWPDQWGGPPGATEADRPAILGMRYFTDPLTGGTVAGQASRVVLATFGQVGSVFGLGLDNRTGNLYAGAYYKRYSGLTDQGPGAIFRVTQLGTVATWAKLDAGADAHPSSPAFNAWVGPAPNSRDMSWPSVGRAGLGSVKVDPDDDNVYAVNLFDRKLYRLPLTGDDAGRVASATPIPDPGCTNGDWRPFAIGFDRPGDVMYVGGVCSAETSQAPADLSATVYRVTDPDGTPTFGSPVLTFPLNTATYQRIDPYRNSTSNWRPWPTTAAIKPALAPPEHGRGTRGADDVLIDDESYPELSGIQIDSDGSMILAFRDLMGDMSGTAIGNEGNSSSGKNSSITVQGDLLRAAPTSGGFALESRGVAGTRTGFGPGCSRNNDQTCFGPIGPGGGYFYNPHAGLNDMAAPSEYQGAILQLGGFRDVMTSQTDVQATFDNGFLWHDNTNGSKTRTIENELTQGNQAGLDGFAKANGLGDLDAYRGRAPVQIGNRVWYDDDNDGIQDPGEKPVTGLIVELVDADGNVEDTTRTDDQGEYVFPIAPDTSYTVRIALDQPQLDGWWPTKDFIGDNPRDDSNGRLDGGSVIAKVNPHAPGRNDHSYDFGFSRKPPPPPPPPPPRDEPAEQPPAPEQPEYAGANSGITRNTPLVLVKYLSRGTSTSRKLQFTMILRNGGASTVSGAQVCDHLPSLLDYLGATKLARRLSGRRVCWRPGLLTSGEARKLRVDTQVREGVLKAVIVNAAKASANGVKPATARARVRRQQPRVTG